MAGTQAIRDLKIELNQFALYAEFPRLDLDDRLGPDVVEALRTIHAKVVAKGAELAAPFKLPVEPDDVLLRWDEIVRWLHTAAREALTVGQAGA